MVTATKSPLSAKFMESIAEDFSLCMPPVVRVFLRKRGDVNVLNVAMSPLNPEEMSERTPSDFFYFPITLEKGEEPRSNYFLNGSLFWEKLKSNETGTFSVKAGKTSFVLDGEEIPILSVGENCPDPEGASILFDLQIDRTVALRLDVVMEAASRVFPDSQWVTLSLVEKGVEMIFSSPAAAMVAKVSARKGLDSTNTTVNSVSFPKSYWGRISSLLKNADIKAYYLQSTEDYLILGARTKNARFVGLLPLESPSQILCESPSVNLDWYDDPGQLTVSLEDKEAIASFVQAVNSVPGESVDLIPEKTGLKVVGTDYTLPLPQLVGLDEKITVPKAYLVGALMTSTLNVTALILGIHLPLTLQLVKGTVSVLLAFKTLFSPVEEKPLQEVAKKAKKKKVPVETGDVTITPLPEETVAIAQAIAENAGADDQNLLGMIEEVQKCTPAPTKGEQVLEGPLEEVYLGLKVLGRYLTLSFDLKGLKFQAFLSAPSEKSES